MFTAVSENKGGLDIVIANAGDSASARREGGTPEHFDTLFTLNVRAAQFTVQKALPHPRDGSSIILAGSTVGSKGAPGTTV